MSEAALHVFVVPSVRAAPVGRPDVVVLAQESGWTQLRACLAPALAAVVPVIDASGTFAAADARIGSVNAVQLVAGLAQVQPICAAMARLPEKIWRASDPHLWALARLAVRGELRLDSLRSMQLPMLQNWPALLDDLIEAELLARTQEARVKLCAVCGAGRLKLNIAGQYHCHACGHCQDYDQLVDFAPSRVHLTERGRQAVEISRDIAPILAEIPARRAFSAQLQQGGAHEEEALLVVRAIQFGNGAAGRRGQKDVSEALAPLARPYILERCVVAHFSDSPESLRDSLPHVRALLDYRLNRAIDFELDVMAVGQFAPALTGRQANTF